MVTCSLSACKMAFASSWESGSPRERGREITFETLMNRSTKALQCSAGDGGQDRRRSGKIGRGEAGTQEQRRCRHPVHK